MKSNKKPYVWGMFYALLLLAFTLFVVLDTFVIPRTYTVVDTDNTQFETQTEITISETETESYLSDADSAIVEEAVITDNAYSDGNISITITEYREYDTSIYVADIVLINSSYLQTAFADDTYGKNITQKTSSIATINNAILAINGDFYGAQSSGYVIRNGVLYRSTAADPSQEDLVIYADGSFGIIQEGSVTAEQLLENGAMQVLSFGPALIDDGEITVTSEDEVGKAMTSNPRTAIGIIDPLHYVMVVSDGRTSESAGLSLSQLADFMQGLGVATAYNLDGGGSSTMCFCGEVVNNPTTNGKKITERSVSDIVFIG